MTRRPFQDLPISKEEKLELVKHQLEQEEKLRSIGLLNFKERQRLIKERNLLEKEIAKGTASMERTA